MTYANFWGKVKEIKRNIKKLYTLAIQSRIFFAWPQIIPVIQYSNYQLNITPIDGSKSYKKKILSPYSKKQFKVD